MSGGLVVPGIPRPGARSRVKKTLIYNISRYTPLFKGIPGNSKKNQAALGFQSCAAPLAHAIKTPPAR